MNDSGYKKIHVALRVSVLPYRSTTLNALHWDKTGVFAVKNSVNNRLSYGAKPLISYHVLDCDVKIIYWKPEIKMWWELQVEGILNIALLLSALYSVTLRVVISLEIKNLQEDSEVFWNVTPCRLVNRYVSEDEGLTLLRNGGNYCLLLANWNFRDGLVGGVVGKEQAEGRRRVCVMALDVTEKYQPLEHLELEQSLYCKW